MITVVLCIVVGAFEKAADEKARLSLASAAAKAPVFVIDAGHGGLDGGAVGVNGIVEKELNLQIALKLRDMLEFWGFETIMTRETDVSIHSQNAKSVKEMKTSDLHNRLDIVESTPNSVYLGIHQNMFGQSQYDGAQIFYGVHSSESERLAECLQTGFVSKLQPENIRQTKKAEKNLFLLSNITGPAVLIECGFISNPQEAALLCDEEYQNKMVFVIFAAVAEYLSVSKAK
jgi:N-acetylmuramoyl-L-alanine amidase